MTRLLLLGAAVLAAHIGCSVVIAIVGNHQRRIFQLESWKESVVQAANELADSAMKEPSSYE